MYGNEDLEQCLELVRTIGWDWFVDLKYPRQRNPRYAEGCLPDPGDCFTQWVDEIECEHGHGQCITSARAIERRENDDLLFHTLLVGVPEDLKRHWRIRWNEISGGTAWDRPLDSGIERLFAYFVRKVGCDIEVNLNGGGFRYEHGKDVQ